MDSDDPGMVWEPLWVGRPAGTHFSSDGSSPLARSDETNMLEAQAVLGPRVGYDEDTEDDEQSSDLLKWVVGLGLAAIVSVGATKLAPRILSWNRDRRSKAGTPSDADRADDKPAGPGSAVVSTPEMAGAGFESEVEVALEDLRRSMSSAEAQRRLIAILVAAGFIADQMRELSHVRIDDAGSAELQSAMDKLSAPQLTDSLNRMLEADASMLDDETTASLMEAFGGGQVVEGQFVPLRHEKVRDALRLPRSE